MKVAWRRFAFFRKVPLEQDGDVAAALGLGDARVACAHLIELAPRKDDGAVTLDDARETEPLGALLVVGDDAGKVVVCGSDLQRPGFLPPFARRALFAGGAAVRNATGAVVAVAGEEQNAHALRCFAVGDAGEFSGAVAELELCDASDAPAALAVRGDGLQCAVGFEGGSVAVVGLGPALTGADVEDFPIIPGEAPKRFSWAAAAAERVGRQRQTDKAGEMLMLLFVVALPAGAPVVALAFADPYPSGAAAHLFAGSRARRGGSADEDDDAGGEIASIALPPPGQRAAPPPPRVLDSRGCGPALAAYDGRELVVARRDGVYLYTADDRGGALGFDGPKTALACLGDGLVAVAALHEAHRRSEIAIYDVSQRRVAHFSRLPAGVGAAALLATRCAKEREGAPPPPDDDVPRPPPLATLLVATTAGALLRYDEKPTPEKLDALYKERLYPTAVQIAMRARLPAAGVVQVYKMHGDHLHGQRDWDGAVEQYSKTLGHVAPSYVIRKFLDAQKISHLAEYLAKAHAPEVATEPPTDGADATTTRPELTTLLVNCYAKLKDVAALDRLAAHDGAFALDGATGVVALRDAGYVDHAARLARNAGEWAWLALVQLERDPPNLKDALDALPKIPFAEQFRAVRRFGVKLVTAFPDEATELLMRLATAPEPVRDPEDDCIRPEDKENPPCCFEAELAERRKERRRQKRPRRPTALPADSDSDEEGWVADDFMHYFAHKPAYLRLFCDYVMHHDERGRTMNVCTTLLEVLLTEWRAAQDGVERCEAAAKDVFSDAAEKDRNEGDLRSFRETASAKSDDVMALLTDDQAPYDRMIALIMVEQNKFPPGTLFMYETKFRSQEPPAPWVAKKLPWWTRKKLRAENKKPPEPETPTVLPRSVVNQILIQEYHKRGDVASILRICRAEGRADPLLWVVATRRIVEAVPPPAEAPRLDFGDGDDDETAATTTAPGGDSELAAAHADRCADLTEVLAALDEEKALLPVQAVGLCGENEHVPLDAARPYLAAVLRRWHADTEEENAESAKLEAECDDAIRQIHDMKRARVALLPGRGGPTDVAYHSAPGTMQATILDALLVEADAQQLALDRRRREYEGVPEPTAAERAADFSAFVDAHATDDQRKWLEIKKSMSKEVDHEQFFKELDDPETGGFDCVARWLGKGVFENLKHKPKWDDPDEPLCSFPTDVPVYQGEEPIYDKDGRIVLDGRLEEAPG